jgi:2-polyprenyl-6-methoxyphenol hydroxylase-like FAD-dependent oxidoreductase
MPGSADQRSPSPSTPPVTVPVAIVGAGPVGLALALGLARHGVRSTLIERNAGTSRYSKAPGVHVRTREILRRWGMEDRFLAAGMLENHLRLHRSGPGGGLLASVDFRELDAEADRPGLLILEQSIPTTWSSGRSPSSASRA